VRFLVFTTVLLVACNGTDVSSTGPVAANRPPRTDADPVLDVAQERTDDVAGTLSDRPRIPEWGRDARVGAVVIDAPQPESDAGAIAYVDDGDGGVACPGILCDSFDDNDHTAWRAGAGQPGDWMAVDDLCNVQTSNVSSEYLAGSPDWTDVRVRVRVRIPRFGASLAAYRVGVMARHSDSPAGYYAALLRGDNRLELRREGQQLGSSVELPITLEQWHTLELRVSGPAQAVEVTALYDGNVIATATDRQGLARGQVGLVSFGSGTQAQFDDVLVTSIEEE
jgi:hypothetical protein